MAAALTDYALQPDARAELHVHPGEHFVHNKVGVHDVERTMRSFVRPAMPAQHQDFFATIPFVVVAARDATGQPWASILSSATSDRPVRVPDARTLQFDDPKDTGDPLAEAFAPGADVGFLGIELHSRRRNRANGRIAHVAAQPGSNSRTVDVAIDQSYGNCPQYITERRWERVQHSAPPPPAHTTAELTLEQQRWVQRADTGFLATGFRGDGEAGAFGMDASHRGGVAGFVRVDSATQLALPDYSGNNFFQTLGNLVADPRIGLLFVNFANGSLLHITGTATIDWQPPPASAPGHMSGARRIVHTTISSVVERAVALPLRWHRGQDNMRTLRVARRIHESSDVVSFYLEAAKSSSGEEALPPFQPGQYLPVAVRGVARHAQPVHRTYSISGSLPALCESTGTSATAAPAYRLSIKREPHGAVSRHMHDNVHVGDTIQAGRPEGGFVLPPGSAPVVLAAGGIGVTPLVAMLHALVDTTRTVVFAYAARNSAEHALAQEVRELVARGAHVRAQAGRGAIHLHVVYSRPVAGRDTIGGNYDAAGRLEAAVLRAMLRQVARAADAELDAADYVVCGPAGFMSSLVEGLGSCGVLPDRVHTEAFGPASA